MKLGNPFLPSGPPALDGLAPVFVLHGADPRLDAGLDLPPFSVCRFGDRYFIKCGYAATDWDLPPCADAFRFLIGSPGQHTYLNTGFSGPIMMVFNKVVDAATVNLGTSFVLGGSALDEFGTITLEVVSNTILIHNDIGGGDDWAADGDLTITMLPAILSAGSALPLEQPATDLYRWLFD